MYLAYLDDSDTKAKRIQWQVMAGVLIEATNFKFAEVALSLVRDLLKQSGKLDQFDEFHACELYGGYGAFEGIDQELRFEAIRRMLNILSAAEVGVVYGGVDLRALRDEIFGSADPQDICFRMCVKGIGEWSDTRVRNDIDPTPPP